MICLDVLQDGTTKRLREQKEMKRIRELKPILNIKNNPVSRFSNSPAVLPRTRTRRSTPSLTITPDASQPSPSQPATPGRADSSPADSQPARRSRPKKTPSAAISANQTATPVQAGDNTQPARRGRPKKTPSSESSKCRPQPDRTDPPDGDSGVGPS